MIENNPAIAGEFKRKELPKNLTNLGWALFTLGLLLGVIAFFTDYSRAMENYLLAYIFILSIGLGSLFLIALEYITNTEWSVPFRRIVEFLAAIIPFLLILVIPLLLNVHEVFHWTNKDAVESDKLLQGKAPYLNVPFFLIRTFGIILLWILIYYLLIKNSKKQDTTGDQNLTRKNIIISAVFMPLFALTATLTAIDWLMSVEPHWFSTIFGVYFFSGTVVGVLAAFTLIVVIMMEKGFLHPKINTDHLYSLGALMFAFINFWGYIAFSQYLLVWYADLPEENFWFLSRWQGGWAMFSIALIIIHFVVPYSLLLSQSAKMDPKRLKLTSIWILFAHWFDLYWLIMPSLVNKGNGYLFSWIDFVFPIGVVGVIILVFKMAAKGNNLIPLKDPKLQRGLDFHL